jgi:hypothetical protein
MFCSLNFWFFVFMNSSMWIQYLVEQASAWYIEQWAKLGDLTRDEYRNLCKDIMGPSYSGGKTLLMTNNMNVFGAMLELKTSKPENVRFKACIMGLVNALPCK